MAWLTGWSHRKEITLANAVADMQVAFTVNRSAGSDSGFTVYVGTTGCEADYDDIRFTRADGTTLLSLWVEPNYTSSTAEIWTKLAANEHIFLYYGKADATAVSSGTDTFIQYHGTASSNFNDDHAHTGAGVYEARARSTADTHELHWGLTDTNHSFDGNDNTSIRSYSTETKRYIFAYNNGSGTYYSESSSFTTNTYYRLKIINTGSGITGYVDNDQIGSTTITTNLPDAAVGLAMYAGTGTAGQQYSFIRKYAATEPTVSAWGGETSEYTLSKTLAYELANVISCCESPIRRIHGKVTITYSDPLEDIDCTITSSGEAFGTDADDVVDGAYGAAHKWFSLAQNVLDGTYYAAPTDTIGWWSSTLADGSGNFDPAVWIKVEFEAVKTITTLSFKGDDKLGGVPKDFTVKLYDISDALQHTETVVDNTDTNWTATLSPAHSGIKYIKMEITQIGTASVSAKVTEFMGEATYFAETYLDDDLYFISLLEEQHYDGATIPTGNISSNEITVRIDNSTGRFNPDDPSSPVATSMTKNRKIEAWLGIEVPYGGVTTWQSLGVFWSQDWRLYPDSPYVEVVGLDRLSLLGQTEFYTSAIYADQSLTDLAELVLADAGLVAADYSIDTALDSIVIPYTWFNRTSHRYALKEIAEAVCGVVYCDRDGVIVIEPFQDAVASSVTLTSNKYFSKNNPIRWNEIANYIEVVAKPRVLGSQVEIYNDIEEHEVPASSTLTVFCQFNTSDPCDDVQTPTFEEDGGAAVNLSITDHTDYTWATSITFTNADTDPHDVTLIDIEGKILATAGNKTATAEDAASIQANGLMTLGSPIENNYIQSKARAQDIADALLASYKDPRRDVELDSRGYTTLFLGDRISVSTYDDDHTADYTVIRQQITWDGGMRAQITGRRIT